jgi:hypothetical protein
MKTAFLLMAQYNGKAIIPINDVCRDYFPHLTRSKLVQKISAGEIAIPLVRIENSQKSAKGVHLADLAEYLDARAEAARKEMITPPVEQIASRRGPRLVAQTAFKFSGKPLCVNPH